MANTTAMAVDMANTTAMAVDTQPGLPYDVVASPSEDRVPCFMVRCGLAH